MARGRADFMTEDRRTYTPSESSEEWVDAEESMQTLLHHSETSTPRAVRKPLDVDLTPRPLRIIKKIGSGLPRDLQSRKTHDLLQSQSQYTLIPHRWSSGLQDQTGLESSQRIGKTRAPTHPPGQTLLTVPRQRKTSGFTSSSKPNLEPITFASYVPLRRSSNKDSRSLSASLEGYRSFPQGDSSSDDPKACLDLGGATSFWVKDQLLEPSMKPKSGSNPGIEGRNGYIEEKSRRRSGVGPRRQPSFKNRLFQRMRSSLTNRPQTHSTPSDLLLVEGSQAKDRTCSVSSPRKDSNGKRASSSTEERSDVEDMDEALSAFPSPPTSALPSPLTTSVRSISISPKTIAPQDSRLSRRTAVLPLQSSNRLSSLASRPLCKSESTPIIEPQMSIHLVQPGHLSETETAVLVEISAFVGDVAPVHDSLADQNALVIAFLIDNSPGTSPTSLVASCEAVLHIISLLDRDIDQISIYKTAANASFDHIGERQEVVSLGRIDKMKAKRALDSIQCSRIEISEQTRAVIIENIYMDLQNLPAANIPDEEATEHVFGQLFILTSHPRTFLHSKVNHGLIRTHVLQFGCAQQQYWAAMSHNGWTLPGYSGRYGLGSATKSSFNANVQKLIRNARAGHSLDALCDIQVEIQSDKTKVRCAQGSLPISSLRAGETRTLLFTLSQFDQPCPKSPISRFDSSIDGVSLTNEIERMLNFTDSIPINVRLSFRHPSLSQQTMCLLEEEAAIPRKSGGFIGSEFTGVQQTHERLRVGDEAMRVVGLFALHTASHELPQPAIDRLQLMLGLENLDASCIDIVKGLLDELRSQTQITQRQTLQNSPVKARHIVEPRLYRPEPPKRHPKRQHSENYKPIDWITLPEDEDLSSKEAEPVSDVTEQLGFDDARRIWASIRDATKGPSEMQYNPIPPTKRRLDGAGWHQSLAVRTKRSMGAPSIRSFTTPSLRSQRGIGAPWL